MVQHLDGALTDFREQVRAGHANVRVLHKDGSHGGAGAFTLPWLLGLLALVAWRGRRAARGPAAR